LTTTGRLGPKTRKCGGRWRASGRTVPLRRDLHAGSENQVEEEKTNASFDHVAEISFGDRSGGRAISTAWRQRLFTSAGAIDLAEAVHAGIETALDFIGVKVEEQEERQTKEAPKPARVAGRFAVEVPNLKTALPNKKARKVKSARKGAWKALAAPAASLKGKGHVTTAWRTAPRRSCHRHRYRAGC
jgi:hypothetical protein